MPITKLNIASFRNINSISIELSPSTVNIIQGQNGSGKTSFLEAIHYLGLGKSFRTHLINRIISHDNEAFSLFANIRGNDNQSTPVGIERSRDGSSRMRVAGKDINTASKLAEILPLQLLEPHSFSLLEGGPTLRRSFIDWGVFHVEHEFHNVWKNYSRAIKQRNMALRMQRNRDEVFSWNKEIIENALKIDVARKQYIKMFHNTLTALLPELIDLPTLDVNYYPGWPVEKSYETALFDAYPREKALAYTQYGPHHADLKIKVNKIPAKEVLSRGQQKLFICAMKICQGLIYKQIRKQSCIYLLDDLVSELDIYNQQKVLQLLSDQKSQIFITCTDATTIYEQLGSGSTNVIDISSGKI